MAISGDGSGDRRRRLAIQILRGRWFTVFASLLILSAAGATYIFGAYSNDIKTSLSYDQSTLNTLSFFKDLGGNVGILSGLINEVAPPSVVLAIGAAMNLAGYLMIYLAVSGKIARPPVWQMCLYICVGANSQTFANTGALVTCVKNFPASRGVVLGLLKGFVGLSGAIITQLYLAFYGDDTRSLVLFIGWLPAAISLVSINTVRDMGGSGGGARELRTFYNFLYMALALAGYLMVVIIVEKKVEFSKQEYGVAAGVTILLLFLPLILVVLEEIKVWNNRKELSSDGPISVAVAADEPPKSPQTKKEEQRRRSLWGMLSNTFRAPERGKEEIKLRNRKELSSEGPISIAVPAADEPPKSAPKEQGEEKRRTLWGILSNTFRAPERGEDYTILQALVSIDMIVLFAATICGVGGTLTAIDNMGQIGVSLGYPAKSISTFVSLISIWNCLGRFASGFLSEALLTSRFKIPRPLILTGILLLSCVGHLLIAFGVPGSLYISSIVIGFCFGAQWPIVFAIISEVFGLKYYSTLYNFGGSASPIGSYILNVKVAGYLYDREAERQNSGAGAGVSRGKSLPCVGVDCFKMSFLIITGATVFGALVSLVLVWRTREFYRGDLYRRFRVDAARSESVGNGGGGGGGGGVPMSSVNDGAGKEEEEAGTRR